MIEPKYRPPEISIWMHLADYTCYWWTSNYLQPLFFIGGPTLNWIANLSRQKTGLAIPNGRTNRQWCGWIIKPATVSFRIPSTKRHTVGSILTLQWFSWNLRHNPLFNKYWWTDFFLTTTVTMLSATHWWPMSPIALTGCGSRMGSNWTHKNGHPV